MSDRRGKSSSTHHQTVFLCVFAPPRETFAFLYSEHFMRRRRVRKDKSLNPIIMKLGTDDRRQSRSLKIVFVALLTTVLAATVCTDARNQGSNVQRPNANPSGERTAQTALIRTGQVNDFVRALDDDMRRQLEEVLAELKRRSQIEFIIVV